MTKRGSYPYYQFNDVDCGGLILIRVIAGPVPRRYKATTTKTRDAARREERRGEGGGGTEKKQKKKRKEKKKT